MAQLYDCFAKGGLTPISEIYAGIEKLSSMVTDYENVALSEASFAKYQGRMLAKDLVAPINIPHFANAAVDGYAFSHQDLTKQNNGCFRIVAVIEAGNQQKYSLQSGEAAIIFTGAAMPENADTVLMYEDAKEDIFALIVDFQNDIAVYVTISKAIQLYDNYRHAGDDVSAGDVVAYRSSKLTPAILGLLAALGFAEIPLFLPLKIALFSTGNELHQGGSTALQWGEIYDANRPILLSLLARQGVQVQDYGIIADDKPTLMATLDHAARHHDLIITSGAMSQGGKDYIRDLLQESGKIQFVTAAIKPGRPVAMGAWKNVPLLGLPGNPVAAFTVFLMIALPIIQKLSGGKMLQIANFVAIADFHFKKRPNRIEYVRIKVTGLDQASHLPILSLYGKRGAGVISSLVGADGFAALGNDCREIVPNMRVNYIPFHQFFCG